MAKFQVPSETDSESQATNLNTPERVEAWLAKNGAKPRYSTSEGPESDQTARQTSKTTYIIPEENSAVSEVSTQDGLQKRRDELLHEHFGFEKLKLCWDPRVRLLFKHVEGNSAISVNPEAARQEISAEPTGVLRRPDDPLEVKVLGSMQSRSEVKCMLAVNSIQCKLYYSPNSDNVVLINSSSRPVTVRSSSGTTEVVEPLQATTLSPAYWKLSNRNDAVDLQLLACRYTLRVEGKTGTAERRLASDDLPEPAAKKTRTPAGASVSTTPSKAASCFETPTTVWAGVDLEENQLVKVTDIVTGNVEYSVRRLTNWAHKTNCSEAFKAILDDGTSEPEAVVVKMLAKPYTNSIGDRGVTIQTADLWRREFQMHRTLQHPRIAALRGWDARMLCLFVEYKQSKDLASDFWRSKDGTFRGGINDAYRILAQMSNVLKYLEEHDIAHNDIKPGNILYTKTDWPATGPFPTTSAGAVLIDFGLATAGRFSGSGTPWYIAPEIRSKKRGPPADVFSLGVVMLYIMRRIPLPETWTKYPPWRLEREPRTTAVLRAIQLWEGEVDRQAKALKSPRAFVREAKLYDLVSRMLSFKSEDRITASELAEETKSWDTGHVEPDV